MRNELKKFDWHVYGLTLDDFSYTQELIKKIIDNQNSELEEKIKNLKDQYKGKSENESEILGEIISDLGHYNYVNNQFLWHFALTRAQGVFEGILKQEFFPDKNLIGLKKKMIFVKGLKYRIEDSDYSEIIEWGKLRNALAHFPPEKYRPGLLNEDDVNEYIDLVKKVLSYLIEEKETRCNNV